MGLEGYKERIGLLEWKALCFVKCHCVISVPSEVFPAISETGISSVHYKLICKHCGVDL